jgi:hypothetical protein
MNPELDLEKQMDRELRSLPAPRAPETLAPRVMAAIAAQAALPWHRRPWFEWPRGWQVASAALTVAFFAVLMARAPWRALAGAGFVAQFADRVEMWTASMDDTADRMLRIALPLWSTLAQQYLIYALAAAGTLMATVIALGSAARQLVLKEIQSK